MKVLNDLTIPILSTLPSFGMVGRLVSVTGIIYYDSGSAWIDLTATGSGGGSTAPATIAYKTAAALPSAYPLGLSWFVVAGTALADGWPDDTGFVITEKLNTTGETFQRIVRQDGTKIWTRGPNIGGSGDDWYGFTKTFTSSEGFPVSNISASGTRDATTYLRGDNVWATIDRYAFKTITTSNALALVDQVIAANASTAAIIITLPVAATAGAGKYYTIKKIDATANTVEIDANGTDTIDGAINAIIRIQYNSITLVSDGTNWMVI